MAEIIESQWPLGWLPSYNDKALAGQGSQGLLVMQNLTLDDRGVLRVAKSSNLESLNLGYQVNSIYASLINGLKLRYLYDANGNLRRNFGAAGDQNTYDLLVSAGGTTTKAAYLQALGHVFMIAGTKKYKDRQDIQWPLGIPAPFAPTAANTAAVEISLANLNAGNYTNWTAPISSAFVNAGAEIDITGSLTSGVAAFQTIYASLIDTTNFGVTGEDDPSDLFAFFLQVADATQLNYLRVDFYCQDPTGAVTDSFYAEEDYNTTGTLYSKLNYFTSGVTTTVSILRSQFIRSGNTSGVGWNTIKAVKISIGCITATAISKFSGFQVGSGVVTGENTYIVVEANDTGQYLEMSIASAAVTVSASINFIRVDRSAHAVNAQANSIRYFRQNLTLGEYIEVHREIGARGFTPAAFTDNLSDNDALAGAAVDGSKILQFFRTALPNDIIGMIYFASRIIYLMTDGFFPSFALDPGSYDSRFLYQITGSQGEVCLFIAKLDVGTFIVATTKDFYRVTGTFSLININNADGTVTTIQDVSIISLGVADPAVNRTFIEVDGNIMYTSATGIRTLNNGTSTLINTSLDLLFRGETRYGQPNIMLHPNDADFVGCATSGTRIYWSLPCSDGNNYIFVNTFNAPSPSDLRGSSHWRLLAEPDLTSNPSCMVREDDGTILFSSRSVNNYVKSLENFNQEVNIKFQTQFNFGQSLNPKQSGSFKVLVDTGGKTLNYVLFGIQESGNVLAVAGTITAGGLTLVELDPHNTLGFCLAFALEMDGSTNVFSLSYVSWIIVQELPPIVFFQSTLPVNFGKANLKKIAALPFVIDPLGSQITVTVLADGQVLVGGAAIGTGISTGFWRNFTDTAAVDWEIQLASNTGMRFFKWMPPELLQIFPAGKQVDQLGPFDIDQRGLIYGMRLRLYTTTPILTYEIFDADVQVYTNTITTKPNQDEAYLEAFPKGINPAVCRILLGASAVFYRFSLELKLRATGKETDEVWLAIK